MLVSRIGWLNKMEDVAVMNVAHRQIRTVAPHQVSRSLHRYKRDMVSHKA
jgi:hypothetical protein